MALLVHCLAFTVRNSAHPQPLRAPQLVELLFLHTFTAFHIMRIYFIIFLSHFLQSRVFNSDLVLNFSQIWGSNQPSSRPVSLFNSETLPHCHNVDLADSDLSSPECPCVCLNLCLPELPRVHSHHSHQSHLADQDPPAAGDQVRSLRGATFSPASVVLPTRPSQL